MKKFGTFGKVLAGLTITIVICIATRNLWGHAAAAGITWICQEIGVNPPQALINLIDQDALGSTMNPGTTNNG
jgi:hypothetical protein